MVQASVIFEMLGGSSDLTHVRHEIACPFFASVRRGLGSVIGPLLEDDVWRPAADRMRLQLFEWLTTPLPYVDFNSETLDAIGDEEAVCRRWGEGFARTVGTVRNDLKELNRMVSPLRSAVEDTLFECLAEGAKIRVITNRHSRATFESLPFWDEHHEKGDIGLLHTPRDYRIADPFDVLIRVGPLRSSGYAACHPAIVNAPRYRTLQQLIWAGLADDQGFGNDPLLATLERVSPTPETYADGTVPGVRWHRRQKHSGSRSREGSPFSDGIDELTLFGASVAKADKRPAVLIEIGHDQGVLYPLGSQVLELRKMPTGNYEVIQACATELEVEGSFLGLPNLDGTDLGSNHADEGSYSRLWKQRLNAALAESQDGLEAKLKDKGVGLSDLKGCLERWSKPASTVIHAPQHHEHLKILVEVLGIEDEPEQFPRPPNRPWWELAWTEVVRSRGQAVQFGIQTHQIIHEETLDKLRSMHQELTTGAEGRSPFEVDLAPSGFEGTVVFYPVHSVETGYRAPDSILRAVLTLGEACEWRA